MACSNLYAVRHTLHEWHERIEMYVLVKTKR